MQITANNHLFKRKPGEVVTSMPYAFDRAMNYSFILKSDMRSLQEICDKWINNPARGIVRLAPIMPFVMLTFAEYPIAYSPNDQIRLQNGSAIGAGFVSYKEVFVTIFAGPGNFPCNLTKNVYGIMPFLFVDNFRAITAGREGFLVPKIKSEIDVPNIFSTQNMADPFVCSTMILPPTSSPNTPVTLQKIIEIVPKNTQTWKLDTDFQPNSFSTFTPYIQNYISAGIAN